MSADRKAANPPAILIVDDEAGLVKGLSLTFEREGFRVVSAGDGQEALRLIASGPPDVVILDLMLPGLSGLDVCQRLRADTDPAVRGVPVIMLTARDDDVDKVVGLEVGADDYVTKPFNSRELVARARAVLRRRELDRQSASGRDPGPAGGARGAAGGAPASGSDRAEGRLVFGELVIDTERRRVSRRGRPIPLTAREFDLLAFLAASPGRVYSREQLLTAVWGYEFAGADRTVDVHVRRLREKLEPDPPRPVYVLTSWGRGYYFSDALEGADR
ncbi:MAG: response regulator transcription factor [Bacillota bacterium]